MSTVQAYRNRTSLVGGECTICYSKFTNPVETICQHAYCADCLDRWLECSTTCPMCRKILCEASSPTSTIDTISNHDEGGDEDQDFPYEVILDGETLFGLLEDRASHFSDESSFHIPPWHENLLDHDVRYTFIIHPATHSYHFAYISYEPEELCDSCAWRWSIAVEDWFDLNGIEGAATFVATEAVFEELECDQEHSFQMCAAWKPVEDEDDDHDHGADDESDECESREHNVDGHSEEYDLGNSGDEVDYGEDEGGIDSSDTFHSGSECDAGDSGDEAWEGGGQASTIESITDRSSALRLR